MTQMQDIILSPIPLSDLQGLISDSVKDALQKHTLSLAIPVPQIMNGEEVERKLNITRQTLARWRKQKRIPFIQESGVIRYDWVKIIAALELKQGGRK
jgi:hypothetical protein